MLPSFAYRAGVRPQRAQYPGQVSSPFEALPSSLSSLSECLQTVTEALAAARTQDEVLGVVLQPALEALGAGAAAVLLVTEGDDRLMIAATQGHAEDAQTFWQDAQGPAGDALKRCEPLFFEQEGDLVRAYPELEARPGGLAVATAVLPMFLDEQPVGAIVLDFREPHHFTTEEQRFLRILAAQCALSLGRARLMADLQRQVQERTRRMVVDARAHEAFVAFTEAVGTETDLLALARQAIAVSRDRFPSGSIGYYTKDGDLWKAQAWSEDMGGALLDSLRAGLPGSTPLIRRALETGTAVFTDAWNPEREAFEHTQDYGTAAAYPLVVNGEVRHLLLFGLRDTRRWTARDKALVRAVGRSLNLALEREEQRRAAEERAEAALFVSQSRLRFALDAAGLGDWELDLRDGRATRSLQHDAIFGYPQGHPDWTYDAFLAHVLPVDRDEVDRKYRVALERGEAWDFQCRVRRADGEVRWIWARGSTLPDVDGTPTHMLGLVQDITETQQAQQELHDLNAHLEARVQERTRALEAANEELVAFTYSISHDLRTPVRHVSSFVQLLRRSLGEGLNAQAARYLNVVEEAAGRMNTLIDGILQVSRTSRLTLNPGPVDLEALLIDLRREMQPDLRGREVSWEVEPLPVVRGDGETLRQALRILIDNALKFTRMREVAHIRIWAEERPGEWAVFVQDNGVGFNPQYAGRLFGIFQRLHRQEEFEGAGVGLANLRRIVTRHGGQVTAAGQPGAGATFGFTLPREGSAAGDLGVEEPSGRADATG